LFHIVWGTKYRIPFFSRDTKQKLYKYISSLVTKEEAKLLAIGGTYDHVHLLVQLDSTKSLPTFVRDVKAKSSKFINAENRGLDYFAWQKGYGVFSVSFSMVDTVKNYISKQEEHHQVSKFEDEINFLLRL
jgi:REP element-mobilizing transposase RayT